MRKKVFNRIKNKLAILLMFFVIISMTATAVSAAYDIQHHPSGNQGGYHPSGQQPGKNNFYDRQDRDFHRWHDHKHHHHYDHYYDHYYDGIYYPDYEWIYNLATLVWDWIYIPGPMEVQPAVPVTSEVPTAVQPAVGDAIVNQRGICA
jgi:hypothetical protein